MTALPLSKFKIAFDKFVEIYGKNDPEFIDLKLFYDANGHIVVNYEAEVRDDKGHEYYSFGNCLFKVDEGDAHE